MSLAFYSQFCEKKQNKLKHIVYFTISFFHKMEKIFLMVFWIIKVWSHICLSNIQVWAYHWGRVFATTIKYSPHFQGQGLICLLCDCKDKFSQFVYKPHGHFHTGDLDLRENIPLYNQKMGAKFSRVNFKHTCMYTCFSSLDCIIILASKILNLRLHLIHICGN